MKATWIFTILDTEQLYSFSFLNRLLFLPFWGARRQHYLQVLYSVRNDGVDSCLKDFLREKHDIVLENCIFQIVLVVRDGLIILILFRWAWWINLNFIQLYLWMPFNSLSSNVKVSFPVDFSLLDGHKFLSSCHNSDSSCLNYNLCKMRVITWFLPQNMEWKHLHLPPI